LSGQSGFRTLRYFQTTLFILFLGVAALVVEAMLRLFHSSYSLTDSRGPGEWSFLAIALAAMLLFTWYVARIDSLQFIARYMMQWRRTLKGFLLMFCATMLLAAAGYLVLAAFGYVQWSQAEWENLRVGVVEKIAIALLIVLVLAMVEETIFRAFVLRYLRYNDSLWVTVSAVVVSSAIFSVSHLVALIDVWHLISKAALLTGLFTIGLLLGTVYVVTGSLACSIGVHCGLLGFKVILIRTHVVSLVPDWLVADDIRRAPLAWLAFLLSTLAVILWRRRLHAAFSVETAVCPDGDGEFKLPARSPARNAPLGAPP
jgi:membrane protease YdiL (CAAX protease family)